ncbi:MAG: hypothetical protein F4Z75_03675, partial [Synechococcus sp. SB0668_bin_15]|nr:hypothetical protein [Synechococcus sp. SB0668_bin_15]
MGAIRKKVKATFEGTDTLTRAGVCDMAKANVEAGSFGSSAPWCGTSGHTTDWEAIYTELDRLATCRSSTTTSSTTTSSTTTSTQLATPTVTITAGSGISEGTAAGFTLTANPAPAAALTVAVTVAQSGDYAAAGAVGSKTVTIPTGGTATYSVATVDDSTDEADGSISFTLNTGTGYTVGSTATATVVVTDNDVPEITVTAGSGVSEGTAAVFTLTANPAPAAPLTVAVTVAQSGDYAATGATGSKTVTIPTGGTATYSVSTVDDSSDEANGSVSVTVNSGTGYTVGSTATATVAVSDDDLAAVTTPSFSIDDLTVKEEAGMVSFKIKLSPPSTRMTGVYVQAKAGSATSPADYLGLSQPLIVPFPPGQTERTAKFYVQNDSHDEGNESFQLVLSNPMGGAVIADGVAEVTIENTDPMPAAWLPRFGRTVSQQVVDALQERFSAPPTPPGLHLTMAGEELTGSGATP